MSFAISSTSHSSSSSRSIAASARELALMVTVFLLYRQVRHLTSGEVDRAMTNANHVVHAEQRLGIFSEASLQHLVLRSRWAIEFLDHYYVFVHFTASVGFMAWIFVRHPAVWPRVRAWFLAVTLVGLAIHVAFPLAPPRMLANRGFVDTLHAYGPSIYSRDVTASAANQLAAMPSLHFAWALIVAVGVISVRRSRWSLLIVLHPAITLLAIIATANHYWLDATVGGVLVVTSTFTVRPATRWQLGQDWALNGRRSSLSPSSARGSRLAFHAVEAHRQHVDGSRRDDRSGHRDRRGAALAEQLVVGHRSRIAERADGSGARHSGRLADVLVRRHDSVPVVHAERHRR
jgi:PAP2 superfamily